MYKRRRERVEQMLEMIRNARAPITPTSLMNKCNMSWNPSQRYSTFLIKKGFIEELPVTEEYERRDRRGRNPARIFKTTKKGVELLDQIVETTLFELFTYRGGGD